MHLRPSFKNYLSRAAALIALVIALLTAVIIFYTFRSKEPDYDLNKSPSDQTYQTTRFEFRYGPKTRIIEDPHNQLRFGYGSKPDSISVKNGQRLIVFTSSRAALHTKTDSIKIGNSSVRYKGWNGVDTNASNFKIDSDGIIHLQGVKQSP